MNENDLIADEWLNRKMRRVVRKLRRDALKRNLRFICEELSFGKVPENIKLSCVNIKYPPGLLRYDFYAPVDDGEHIFYAIERVDAEWIWFFSEADAAASLAKYPYEWGCYLAAKGARNE